MDSIHPRQKLGTAADPTRRRSFMNKKSSAWVDNAESMNAQTVLYHEVKICLQEVALKELELTQTQIEKCRSGVFEKQ